MNKPTNLAAWRGPIAGLMLLFAAHAGAGIVEGRTPGGVAYTSGGVSDEELSALRQRFGSYTLHVTTAAKGSGAHLASVLARISDSSKRVVLEHRMEGPWLLANLPPGRYSMELRYPIPGGERELVERRDITVGNRGLTESTVYFASGD